MSPKPLCSSSRLSGTRSFRLATKSAKPRRAAAARGIVTRTNAAASTDTVVTERAAVRAPFTSEVLQRLRLRRVREVEEWGQDAHDALYLPARAEVEGDLELLHGQVPSDFPAGAYLRNGPNHPFYEERGEDHVFDCDGMVHAAIVSEDGTCQYFNRYVKTETHKQEQAAGRKLFGGIMSRSGINMISSIVMNSIRTGTSFKDTANTSLLWFNNTLMALMEASPPIELKFCNTEEQLTTVQGYYDFDGQLDHPMTAHPKICPRTGEAIAFGYSAESRPYMSYSVFSPDGRRVVSQPIDLEKPVMTHDMAITENYTILLDLPLVFDPANILQNKFVFGFDATHPARIGIMPRYGGKVEWFQVDPCNVFHTVNAFEDEETGEVVLHGGRCTVERDLYFEYNPAYMYEWRFTPGSNGMKKTETLLDDTCIEFPKINNEYIGCEYKYGYVLEGTGLGKMNNWKAPSETLTFANVLKYDMTTGQITDAWRSTDGMVFGELEFVPRTGTDHKPDAASRASEDDGFLVTFALNLKEGYSCFVILDAADLSQGPLAVLKTPQHVPLGLHGTWVPSDALQKCDVSWA